MTINQRAMLLKRQTSERRKVVGASDGPTVKEAESSQHVEFPGERRPISARIPRNDPSAPGTNRNKTGGLKGLHPNLVPLALHLVFLFFAFVLGRFVCHGWGIRPQLAKIRPNRVRLPAQTAKMVCDKIVDSLRTYTRLPGQCCRSNSLAVPYYVLETHQVGTLRISL
jgi:hypothetical protein